MADHQFGCRLASDSVGACDVSLEDVGTERTRGSPLKDLIDDPGFVIGQTLASTSCCTLPVLLLPTALTLQTTVASKVVGYGISRRSFSVDRHCRPTLRTQTLEVVRICECLLNVGFILMFVEIESA